MGSISGRGSMPGLLRRVALYVADFGEWTPARSVWCPIHSYADTLNHNCKMDIQIKKGQKRESVSVGLAVIPTSYCLHTWKYFPLFYFVLGRLQSKCPNQSIFTSPVFYYREFVMTRMTYVLGGVNGEKMMSKSSRRSQNSVLHLYCRRIWFMRHEWWLIC